MDSWTPGQLELMRLGGNDRCNHFLHSHGVTETTIVGVGDETDPHNTTTTKNSNEPNKALLQNRNTKNKTATNNNNTMTSRAHAVIRNKYDSGAAALYKQVLIAERDGLPIPTTVPNNVTSEPIKSQPGGQKKMEGFGSTPLLEARRTDAHWMTKRLMYIAIPAVVGAAVWMLVPH